MSSDDEKDDEKKQLDMQDTKQTYYISFEWNKTKMKSLRQCDTRHIIYLLHRCLREIYRNVPTRSNLWVLYGLDEYPPNREIKAHDLHKIEIEQVTANLVEWYLSDPVKNKDKLNGEFIVSNNKTRMRVTDLFIEAGKVKQGLALKMYKYLTQESCADISQILSDFDMSGSSKCLIPNYKFAHFGREIQLLHVDELVRLIQYILRSDDYSLKKMRPFQACLIDRVQNEKITGDKIVALKRTGLTKEVKKWAQQWTVLQEALKSVYQAIEGEHEMKATDDGDGKAMKAMLQNQVFVRQEKQKQKETEVGWLLKEFEDVIVDCCKTKKMFTQMNQEQFVKKLTPKVSGKLTGEAGKLHGLLTNIDANPILFQAK